MDAFEARLQFIQLLESLNPSAVVINKGVQFALKNKELHEDFHSCILEVLDKLDLNARINVLYFLEALISSIIVPAQSSLESLPYIKNLEKDFTIVLSKTIPNNNLINLSNSVDILQNIEKLYNIQDEENNLLKKKYYDLNLENINNYTDEASVTNEQFGSNGFTESWKFLIDNKKKGIEQRKSQLEESKNKDNSSSNNKTLNTTINGFTKEQILSRIEADRERHKRFKEVSWIVNRQSSLDLQSEFDKLWEQHDILTKEDYEDLKELNQIAQESYNI